MIVWVIRNGKFYYIFALVERIGPVDSYNNILKIFSRKRLGEKQGKKRTNSIEMFWSAHMFSVIFMWCMFSSMDIKKLGLERSRERMRGSL